MVTKSVLSLAQKTTAWLKACGKTSILQTKPVNIASIEGLRYTPGLTEDVV